MNTTFATAEKYMDAATGVITGMAVFDVAAEMSLFADVTKREPESVNTGDYMLAGLLAEWDANGYDERYDHSDYLAVLDFLKTQGYTEKQLTQFVAELLHG